MNSKIEHARALGYTDAQIADYLVPKDKLDLARQHNYSDADILAKYAEVETPAPPTKSYDEEMAAPSTPARNIAGTVLQHAGNVGATLLKPLDSGLLALGVPENSYLPRSDRRAALNAGMAPLNIDLKAAESQVAGVATDIAATAGLPFAGAKVATKFAPAIAPLIEGAGFAKNVPLWKNMLVGAGTGAAAGGLLNPDNALPGAVLGGAIPGVAAGIGGTFKWLFPGAGESHINKMLMKAFGGDPVKITQAAQLAEQGLSADQIAARMNNPLFAELSYQMRNPPAAPQIAQLSADTRLAAKQGQANMLAGAEQVVNPLAQRAATAAANTANVLPGDVAPSIPGAGIRKAGQAEATAIRTQVTDPAYAEARKLGGAAPNVDVSGLVSQARQILGDNFLDPAANPSQVGTILKKLQSSSTTINKSLMGLGQTPSITVSSPPMAAFDDLIKLRAAIGDDAATAAAAGDKAKAAALRKLHDTVDKSVANAPGVTADAKAAWQNASETFRKVAVPQSRTGAQVKVLSAPVNNQPRVVDEKVLDAFFKPGGEKDAQSLLAMLRDNPDGKKATADAIKQKFRDTVVKDNAVMPDAVDAFMRKYKRPLDILENAGVIAKKDLSYAGEVARTAEKSAKEFADKSKLISTLRDKVDTDPTNPVAVKSLAEAEKAVQEVHALLKDEKRFRELVAEGRGTKVGDLPEIPFNRLPSGVLEIVTNRVVRLLSNRVDKRVATTLGKELLDSGALAAALKRAGGAASAKTAPRVYNALAPAAVNALRSE